MKILFSVYLTLIFSSCAFCQIGYITSENANLRSLPNPEAPTVLVLRQNTKIFVKSRKALQGWYQITVNKKSGWLHGNTFSFTAPAVTSDSNKINGFSSDKAILKNLLTEDQKWKQLYDSARTAYFLDIATIQDINNKRIVWVKTVDKDIPFKELAFKISQTSYDCSQKTYRHLTETYFNKFRQSLAKNNVFEVESVVPGSVGEDILSIICGLNASGSSTNPAPERTCQDPLIQPKDGDLGYDALYITDDTDLIGETSFAAVQSISKKSILRLLSRQKFANDYYKVFDETSGTRGLIKCSDAQAYFTSRQKTEESPFESRPTYTSSPPQLTIINRTDRTMTIYIDSTKYTIPSNYQQVVTTTAGRHSYIASVPRARADIGEDTWETGHEYTWTFYIRTVQK